MSTGGKIMVVAVLGGVAIVAYVLWQRQQAAQAAAAAAANPALGSTGTALPVTTPETAVTTGVASGYQPGEINTNPVYLANQAKLPTLEQLKGKAAYAATPRGQVDTATSLDI